MLAIVVIVVIVGVVIISSIAEINAQSGPYRKMVNRSFGALASPLVNSSTQTGRDLATTMLNAAGTSSTRAGLQQMLDHVVSEATAQSGDAANLAPPAAVGSLDQQLVAVFAERAAAATTVRTTVDGLLGLVPLPVAGAPPGPTPAPARALTTTQAVAALSAVGTQIRKTDADYAAVRRALARAPGPVRLPRSSWITGPAAAAPLGQAQLTAAPPALVASSALRAVHQLLISAVGLSPPAVGTPGSTVGDNCANPSSRLASPPASLVPPTRKISAQVTVTNCGTVLEKGVVVSLTVQLAPGSPTPGKAASSTPASPSSARRTIELGPGGSRSLAMGPLAVVPGSQYVVTMALAFPSGQTNPSGTTQAFLVQISS